MKYDKEIHWGFISSIVLHAMLFFLMINNPADKQMQKGVVPVSLVPEQGVKGVMSLKSPPIPVPSERLMSHERKEKKVVMRRQVFEADERDVRGNDEHRGVPESTWNGTDRVGKKMDPSEGRDQYLSSEASGKEIFDKGPGKLDIFSLPQKPWELRHDRVNKELQHATKSPGGSPRKQVGGTGGDPAGYLSTHGAVIEGLSFSDLDGYDISHWASRFVARLRQNWRVPLAVGLGVKGACTLRFAIGPGGELSFWTIMERSGVSAYDQAACEALTGSEPFPELPDDFPKIFLRGQIRFLYGVS